MKNKNEIAVQQKDFIEMLKAETKRFVNSIDKTEIETILLSGSVARGDYFPGELGGMVDLIVMKKPGSTASAEDIFGPNQDPEIPFHCVKPADIWFSILFTDFIKAGDFAGFDEARKYATLEAEIIYDKNGNYAAELAEINKLKTEQCKAELENKINYINYLLSDYKKDRWYRRNAFLQLHENLSTAIRMAVCCLFYKNNSYVPAEDRQLYYSLTLQKLPADYSNIICQLKSQNTPSEEDYNRREALFRQALLAFIEE